MKSKPEATRASLFQQEIVALRPAHGPDPDPLDLWDLCLWHCLLYPDLLYTCSGPRNYRQQRANATQHVKLVDATCKNGSPPKKPEKQSEMQHNDHIMYCSKTSLCFFARASELVANSARKLQAKLRNIPHSMASSSSLSLEHKEWKAHCHTRWYYTNCSGTERLLQPKKSDIPSCDFMKPTEW